MFNSRSLSSVSPSYTITNVACTGNETVLGQCDWEEGSCNGEDLAGVVCLDQSRDLYGTLNSEI